MLRAPSALRLRYLCGKEMRSSGVLLTHPVPWQMGSDTTLSSTTDSRAVGCRQLVRQHAPAAATIVRWRRSLGWAWNRLAYGRSREPLFDTR